MFQAQFAADNWKILSSSQQRQLEAAFHQGVPSELRKLVWTLVIPNKLKVTQKLYKVLLERAKICAEFSDKDTQFKKNLKVIDEDLHRTYADMNLFRAGNKFH
mmetsp:Transcript_14891/g.25371  ORF Transcript_14891/g.25371 Transcript_14891/m.25371 type:complete len:103 (-) Transcript_14891:606-914(-)